MLIACFPAYAATSYTDLISSVLDSMNQNNKEYFECLNSMDLGSLTKMASLAEQAETLDVVMAKIDEMDLSDGDMAYYMEVYAETLN